MAISKQINYWMTDGVNRSFKGSMDVVIYAGRESKELTNWIKHIHGGDYSVCNCCSD